MFVCLFSGIASLSDPHLANIDPSECVHIVCSVLISKEPCGKLLCWNLDEGCDMESLQKNLHLLTVNDLHNLFSFLKYELRSLENSCLLKK